MAQKSITKKVFSYAVVFAFLAAAVYVSRGFYYRSVTIHELLIENKQLKTSLTNLTIEDQIGYAKVTACENRDGRLFTTVKFVETARDDPSKKIIEKEHTVAGDIVYFDALIVKFGDKMVMDGRQKALYLWRRVYGENTPPAQGLPIEQPGAEPQRYKDLLALLPPEQRQLFWTNIWDLANDPEKLKQYDITAIYGNVVYTKLKKGFIYAFKINPSGQLYPQVWPDIYQ